MEGYQNEFDGPQFVRGAGRVLIDRTRYWFIPAACVTQACRVDSVGQNI